MASSVDVPSNKLIELCDRAQKAIDAKRDRKLKDYVDFSVQSKNRARKIFGMSPVNVEEELERVRRGAQDYRHDAYYIIRAHNREERQIDFLKNAAKYADYVTVTAEDLWDITHI